MMSLACVSPNSTTDHLSQPLTNPLRLQFSCGSAYLFQCASPTLVWAKVLQLSVLRNAQHLGSFYNLIFALSAESGPWYFTPTFSIMHNFVLDYRSATNGKQNFNQLLQQSSLKLFQSFHNFHNLSCLQSVCGCVGCVCGMCGGVGCVFVFEFGLKSLFRRN